MGDRLELNNLAATEEIERDVPSRGEHKGARMTNSSGVFLPQQASVGFLDHIVCVAQEREPGLQVSPQRRLMRLHLDGEPAGLLSLLQRHWGGTVLLETNLIGAWFIR